MYIDRVLLLRQIKNLLSGYRDISEEQEMKMTKKLYVHKIKEITCKCQLLFVHIYLFLKS